jgi:6-phosphogluconolactonase/glucosamine-6-phosphate isomerase/deaminase
MKFILTSGWEDGTANLTQCLVRELSSGKKVLWLLSGGSNIGASVEVMDNIPADHTGNLSISLIDERFGKIDFDESNWNKLIKAGFDVKKAKMMPVLETGLNFDQTLDKYREIIKQGFANNDIVVAQLGIGDDGHIAGILPESPAATETIDLVSGYQSQPFLRLTMTFPALRKVDVAYAFAFGNTKQPTLSKLKAGNLPVSEQPAQILKEIPKSFLYSDQVGEAS